MVTTITRLYNDYGSASRAVRDLEAAGLRAFDICLVASNADGWYTFTKKSPRVDRSHNNADDRVEATEPGARIGVLAGGAVGLLAGLGLVAAPGLGPVVAAGWILATAAGVATGGIISALTQTGITEGDADLYAEGVRRGGTVVTARVEDGERVRFEEVLDRGAVDVRQRHAAYKKAGWHRFDDAAPAYDADQVRAEQSMY